MTAIPERLRERALEIVGAWYGQTDVHVRFEQGELLREAIATALHEIEQAAEQRGAERMREAAEKLYEHPCSCPEPCEDYWIWPGGCTKKALHLIRALPAPAEPAKGA